MNIQTALIYATQGYHIKRGTWTYPDYINAEPTKIYIKNGLLMSGDSFIMLTAEDLLASDWELVSPNKENKL